MHALSAALSRPERGPWGRRLVLRRTSHAPIEAQLSHVHTHACTHVHTHACTHTHTHTHTHTLPPAARLSTGSPCSGHARGHLSRSTPVTKCALAGITATTLMALGETSAGAELTPNEREKPELGATCAGTPQSIGQDRRPPQQGQQTLRHSSHSKDGSSGIAPKARTEAQAQLPQQGRKLRHSFHGKGGSSGTAPTARTEAQAQLPQQGRKLRHSFHGKGGSSGKAPTARTEAQAQLAPTARARTEAQAQLPW